MNKISTTLQPILLPSSPVRIERGAVSGRVTYDGETLILDQTVIGQTDSGAGSRESSAMRLLVSTDGQGRSYLQVDDDDAHQGLQARVARDEQGNGLLTVSNPGPGGADARLQFSLGPIAEGLDSSVEHHPFSLSRLSVTTGHGRDSAIVLNGQTLYLDGSIEPVDLG